MCLYFTHCFLIRSTFHMDGPLFATPPPSSCPRSYWMPPWQAGRQAGRQAASFWPAQGTKINDFFRKKLHARLLWGYVQFKRYNTAPLYLARLTYAGFVLCHFGCRIYVWRVTISSKERYYSLTKVYGWWWWRANSRVSFELSSWLGSARLGSAQLGLARPVSVHWSAQFCRNKKKILFLFRIWTSVHQLVSIPQLVDDLPQT